MKGWCRLGWMLGLLGASSLSLAQPAPEPPPPAPADPAAPAPPADPAQPPPAAPPTAQPPSAQPPPAQPPPAQPPPQPYQQPGYQQPGYQQPGYQQPGYQQPGYQQPGQQQPGYQQPPPQDDAQWGVQGDELPERSGFVGIGRLGFVLAGGGEAEFECDGSACVVDSAENDYDDVSGFVLGMDFMGHVAPQLRLGGGFLLAPATEIEPDDSPDYEVGTDLSLLFIVEGVFDVSPKVALALRAMGGPLFVFPSGDLQDDIDDNVDACNDIESAGGSCEAAEGPYVGWTVGGGGGAIFDVGNVALRADLLVQFYGISLLSVDASGDLGSLEAQNSLNGNRILLMAGLEF